MVTICPVAGLVMVDVATSADFAAVAVDSSMFDMADASSFSFSSESWERMDFIPLGGGFMAALVAFFMGLLELEFDWCSP